MKKEEEEIFEKERRRRKNNIWQRGDGLRGGIRYTWRPSGWPTPGYLTTVREKEKKKKREKEKKRIRENKKKGKGYKVHMEAVWLVDTWTPC